MRLSFLPDSTSQGRTVTATAELETLNPGSEGAAQSPLGVTGDMLGSSSALPHLSPLVPRDF